MTQTCRTQEEVRNGALGEDGTTSWHSNVHTYREYQMPQTSSIGAHPTVQGLKMTTWWFITGIQDGPLCLFTQAFPWHAYGHAADERLTPTQQAIGADTTGYTYGDWRTDKNAVSTPPMEWHHQQSPMKGEEIEYPYKNCKNSVKCYWQSAWESSSNSKEQLTHTKSGMYFQMSYPVLN